MSSEEGYFIVLEDARIRMPVKDKPLSQSELWNTTNNQLCISAGDKKHVLEIIKESGCKHVHREQ